METAYVEIPLESISADALNGLVESYILREGTDYGSNEVSLEAKTAQVFKQLKKGDVKIVFDPATESIDLLTARELSLRQKSVLNKNEFEGHGRD